MKKFVALNVIYPLYSVDGELLMMDSMQSRTFVRPDMIVAVHTKNDGRIKSVVTVAFPNGELRHWTVSNTAIEIVSQIDEINNQTEEINVSIDISGWSEENGRNQSGDAHTES